VISAFVLATSVTVASSPSCARSVPARSPRVATTASGGPARTTSPAPSIAPAALPAASSSRPRRTPSPGPAPPGVHATSRAELPASRSARAIEPPIRPKPRNAIRSGSRAAAAPRAGSGAVTWGRIFAPDLPPVLRPALGGENRSAPGTAALGEVHRRGVQDAAAGATGERRHGSEHLRFGPRSYALVARRACPLAQAPRRDSWSGW
jgi:hypothetical protein